MAALTAPAPIPLGSSVPALTAHAISVSLPTWEDNIGYEEGDKRIVDKMETGYPRFFIHRSIQKLAGLCLQKFGKPDELCILLPSPKVASQGRDFLAAQTPSLPSRIVEFVICPPNASLTDAPPSPDTPTASSSKVPVGVDIIELQILLFDKTHWPTAKAFWQHTGDGISSRLAERALAFLGEGPAGARAPTPPQDRPVFKNVASSRNRHYARAKPVAPAAAPVTPIQPTPTAPKTAIPETASETVVEENLTADLSTYLEERYGRNLPLFNAGLAKQALKRRIAGGFLPSDEEYGKGQDVTRGTVDANKTAISEDDVYLYPGGMSAIWHAHDICRKHRQAAGEQEGKSVCYGFPYTDTLKILKKWGVGAEFLGTGGSEDIPNLRTVLETRPEGEGRILSLFCEFPSNPLLRSPDLVEIKKLADQYGFIIVVDETIGNFINVEVAAFADIIVSSLTKIFSGDANVMGGSLILNPNSRHHATLKKVLQEDYEDNYYPEDAVYMERNSRDYRNRIKKVNDNAYDVCEYLYNKSLDSLPPSSTGPDASGRAIKKVYYPRYVTPEIYAQAQRLPTTGKGGFGGLFSVTFVSEAASKAFYNVLGCAKGPSLGTSFTLASPYTILAHYFELDWAAGYGVERGLVRISVGQEDSTTLMGWFEAAVGAAEEAVMAERS